MQATPGAQMMHFLWLATVKSAAHAGNHLKATTHLRRSTYVFIKVCRSSVRKDHSEGATQTQQRYSLKSRRQTLSNPGASQTRKGCCRLWLRINVRIESGPALTNFWWCCCSDVRMTCQCAAGALGHLLTNLDRVLKM